MRKRRILFWALLLIAGSLFTLVFLAMTGNGNQTYSDIVTDYTAIFFGNKSAERSLIYILAIGGAVLCAVFELVLKRRYPDGDLVEYAAPAVQSRYLVCALCVPALAAYLIYAQVDSLFLLALLVAVILFALDRELVAPGLRETLK